MSLEGRTLGIYEIGRELGKGGMGAVYAATTTSDSTAGPAGTTVAIKHFHDHLVEDRRAFERFVREAEVGKSIRHKHVVRTFDLCEEDSCHFMVMEFIEGQTIKDLLVELGTFPDHLLYQVADQALDALAEIHSRDIVHRDIKPENIVITAEHRVLLMDLGVARLVQRGNTMTEAGEFVGSLPYAAPEQFGTAAIGPGCDLYSFGVVMYELATGRCPFDATEIGALLQQKLQGEVAPPSTAHEEVDGFLDEVVMTCLERDVVSRFKSAAELRGILADGRQSSWWRGRAVGRLPGAERALQRLRLPREVRLVGRDRELGRFQSVFADASSEGRVLLVSGPAGVGKSRLVYEAVETLGSASGPLALAGRAVGPGGRAYQAFLEVVHDLVGLDEMPADERREALERKLTELLPDTPAVVSPMAEFLLAGVNPGDESGFSKDALLSSIANMLRTAAAKRPLIVVIEDLQAAGAGTLELFRYVARCVPGHPILLVGVYASDEVEDGSEMHALLDGLSGRADVAELELEPLPRDASDRIVQAYTLNDSAVRSLGAMLFERGEGNPHVALELLAHLRATGALVERDEQLFVEGPTQTIELPASVTDVFALKLGRLDEEQRETLEAAAIMGPTFSASLLAGVLEERRIKVLKRLALLERKHRLIESSGKDSFRFARRQVQEALYQGISPALRSEYHALVAETLRETYDEADDPPVATAFDLVRHLVDAEQALEAEPYLEPALAHLTGAYHATFATPFLERLEHEFAPARSQARFSIAINLWHFYEAQGKVEAQRRILEEAHGFARALGDTQKEGEVHCRLAATMWRIGDQQRAHDEAEKGLALSRDAGNRRWEANSLQAIGAAAWSRGDFDECYRRWEEALSIRREIDDRGGIASSLQALGAVMARVGKPAQASYEMRLEALEIFREIGNRPGECRQLVHIGNSLAHFQRHEEALQYFEQAAVLSRELGDLQSEAFPIYNAALSHLALGRFEKALESFERAVDVFTEVQNRDMQLAALSDVGMMLAQVGEFNRALSALDDAVRLGHETNAKHRLAQALSALGQAYHLRGDRQRGWHYLEQALDLRTQVGVATARVETLSVMAGAALREGDFARAKDLLADELAASAEADMRPYQEVLALARLARALDALGERGEAEGRASEAESRMEGDERWPLGESAEIHWSLGHVLDAPGHQQTARERAARIARAFTKGSYKEHFEERSWPFSEILRS